ncbi:Ferredoxin-dependent glutamate synthase [hydrothermal vent metagenome]|uniref:Ferredoxin-dependent glutamate synthase n=1 Tax=hydrothermal vent metagenome TaxID=652676 RepID=A0A3B0YUV6_9ZZZZ
MSNTLDILHWIFVITGFSFVLLVIWLTGLYIYDKIQTEHAVRRNFPLIGRMRYVLERMGEYFRQYFFLNDREEMPFNRATRNWIYRTAKNIGGTLGFGSSNDLREPGTIIFVNAAYPVLEDECIATPPIVIGENCSFPFVARHVVNISGMSYGALSAPAVTALSKGAGLAGIWMNTGEGGLSPHHEVGGCDLIFQIGTAKYGVRDEHGRLSDTKLKELSTKVKAFEIKLAQGAKPGRGGVLPACKVSAEIAKIRGIPEGVTSNSPNRHPEISCDNDLLDVINHVRDLTGRPVGIKTVLGSDEPIKSLCEAIHRRGIQSAPDFITLDGGNGGTGAAPQVLADYVGLPLNESLPLLVDTLISAGLRERIRVIASGKIVTSANVAWALCMGADFTVTGRGFMFSLGCIQSQSCHRDNCPTGVTTHNPKLQKGLVVADKCQRVANYARWMNREVDRIAYSCGLTHAREFMRHHARMVKSAGVSIALDELYPYPEAYFGKISSRR